MTVSPTMNIAFNKTASQSSVSPWSRQDDAKGALIGDPDRMFGFHTAEEDSPWWEVDLGQIYAVQSIILYNRRDGFIEKARTVSVEVSTDNENWTLIHSGLVYFGHGPDLPPFTLPLAGRFSVRHVRLRLHEKNFFHLWKVEVLVYGIQSRVMELREQLGMTFPVRDLDANGKGNAGYDVIAATSEDMSGPLIGLDVNDNGAYGNSVVQYATAVEMAQTLGLKYIRAATGKLVKLNAPVVLGDITVLPGGAELPGGGCFLRGNFFFRNHLRPALKNSTPQSYHDLVHDHVSQLYKSVLAKKIPRQKTDELTIHIRSGDIFRTWIHADYVQPPLSFYQLVINQVVDKKRIKRVRLVFEDRGNPVVDALEAFLLASNIPFSCQSGSAEEDIAALIDAPHMVYGVGTFGPAVCQFSDIVESVYYFSPDNSCPFKGIPNIGKIVHISDAGDYIKPGEWKNSPEQRATMVEYPVEKLVVLGEWSHTVKRKASSSAKSGWESIVPVHNFIQAVSRGLKG